MSRRCTIATITPGHPKGFNLFYKPNRKDLPPSEVIFVGNFNTHQEAADQAKKDGMLLTWTGRGPALPPPADDIDWEAMLPNGCCIPGMI